MRCEKFTKISFPFSNSLTRLRYGCFMKFEDVPAVVPSLPAESLPSGEEPSALRMETHQKENATILCCQGRIVFPEQTAALSRRVTDLIDENKFLVLDFSGVESIDSAGLGELLLLHLWANGNGHPFCMAAPNEGIRHLLETTNLIAVFRIHSTVDEAIYAMRQRFAESA
jgi:anti-anti-sigma factor